MLTMAYPKHLSSADILKTAVNMVEYGGTDGLSLRAVASALGVKAPSLYRYFPHKEVLEAAVAEEIFNLMLGEFRAASESADRRPGSEDWRTHICVLRATGFRSTHSPYRVAFPRSTAQRRVRPCGTSCWRPQAVFPDSRTTPPLPSLYGRSCMATPLLSTSVCSVHPGLKVDLNEASKLS